MPRASEHLQGLFTAAARPLPSIDDPNFASHFDSFGDYPVVLLGDGSHGTSEFYSARAEITKRLIEHHGFNIVAVEADWPDAELVDRYVRRRPGPKASINKYRSDYEPFGRFPTWMWRNHETQNLVEWMRNRNARVQDDQKAGFYGLDMYSMGESMHSVIRYLERVDPKTANTARLRYACLAPWVEDPAAYGLAAVRGLHDCEAAVVKMLRDLLDKRMEYAAAGAGDDGDEYLSSEQNAYLVRDAERYYKAMYYSSAASWTLRDTHMIDALKRLRRSKPRSKAVVWAHNSHCGDARYTGMGRRRDEVNLGQLCREQFGRENVALIGCGTHAGTVAAAHEWDDNMQVMTVRPSRSDSWERVAHDTHIPSFWLDLRPGKIDPELAAAIEEDQDRLERFIGVIYRPETEKLSHYSQAELHNQFDAYIWFDETTAVQSLDSVQPRTSLGSEETYPFGE